jgi:endonuclease/exonuclease/phosphatase (EEP) superfamily protein YafD
LRLIAGDRWWWLALANVASLYLFLPLVVLLPLAIWSRNRAAIVATAAPLVVFVFLYGGLFLPRVAPQRASGTAPLRILTLNVLGGNDDGAPVAQLVTEESPDLVCLQELNPRMAEDLVARLGQEYPYYALLPEEGVTGLGVFSRHPLQDGGEIPDPAWAHGAQVVTVEFEGRPVLVLNVHAMTSWLSIGSRSWGTGRFEQTFRLREQQARLWLERVAQHDGPAIVAGDCNTTDQNESYRLLAAELRDAHRRAGWAWGHTFPAIRGYFGPIPAPRRLLRLDYVWHSEQWGALAARVGRWDGQSDHRPLVITLLLRPQ